MKTPEGREARFRILTSGGWHEETKKKLPHRWRVECGDVRLFLEKWPDGRTILENEMAKISEHKSYEEARDEALKIFDEVLSDREA